MEKLSLDRLKSDELSFSSNGSAYPLVVRWKEQFLSQNKQQAISYFRENANNIRQMVKDNGAVLFRDLPITSASDYEGLLNILGYDLYKSNFAGASPRSNVTQKTFVSTEVPKPFIIGYHTEFCYQSTRPGMISFFCIKTGAKFGETPIFDCAKVWDSLSEKLRTKLETKKILYKRYFVGKKSVLNFRKTWQDTFQTTDKSEVEAYLTSEDMSFEWDTDGGLTTKLEIPAMLCDPTNGKKRLSITMFNLDSLLFNFNYFRKRYNPIMRKALEGFVKREYRKKNIFLEVSFGDETSFSCEESEEIQRAAWDNAIAFHWKPQDLLILDNIGFSHSRLNVKQPRSIIAAMADQYDVRDYNKLVLSR